MILLPRLFSHWSISLNTYITARYINKAILEKIQRRAVSIVSGLKGVNYKEKLVEVGIPTLEERRHQADMVQTFKIVKWMDRVESSS
jgi:hypothetical protein